jgi:cytochrome c-type biogenesis protein CcmH/NrfG
MWTQLRVIGRDPMVMSVLLAALTVLTHSQILHNDFTLDDFPAIVENPVVADSDTSSRLTDVFTTNFWGGRARFEHVTTWRPLTTLTFSWIHDVAGPNPMAFHLVSLCLHGLVTSLVFWLVLLWFERFNVAVLAGAMYALLPVHVEVIAGAVNLAEIQAAIFYLAGLIMVLRVDRQEGPRRNMLLAVALVCFLLGLLSKEHAVTWPVALVLIQGGRWLRFRREPKAHTWPRMPPVWFMGVTVAIIGVYLWARAQALPALLGGDIPVSDNPMVVAPWGSRILTVAKIYFQYLRLLVAPMVMTADYSAHVVPTVTSFWDADALAGLVAIAATVALLGATIRRVPDVAGALLVFLMMASLIGNVFFLNTIIMAERLMYLPSVGWCAFLALIIGVVWEGARWHAVGRRVLLMGIVLVLGLYALRSWQRVPVWQDNLTLFGAAVADAPDCARAHRILAYELVDRGRAEEALSHARDSIRIEPSKEGYELVGDLYWQRQDGRAALDNYRQSFAAGATSSVLGKLCLALVETREVAAAVKRCQNAVKIQPNHATLRLFLGLALDQSGRPVEALDALKRAISLAPDDRMIRREYERLRSQLPAPLR